MDFNTALGIVIAEITPQPWDYTDPDGTTLTVIPAGLSEEPGCAEVMIRITTRGVTGLGEFGLTTHLTRGAAEVGITTTDMPHLIAALTERAGWEHGDWGDRLTVASDADGIALTVTEVHIASGQRVEAEESMHLPEEQRLPLASALRRAADVARGWEESPEPTPREVGLADRRWDCRNDDTE